MMIYNVTTKVHHTICHDWLNWIKDQHIPDLVGTGCFTHAVVLHLIEADDEEGKTFAVQYHTTDVLLYEKYIATHADEMRKRSFDKWGDRIISFRTLMEVVN